jgi:4-hydroxy-tetrahydrodipicolinate reductase
MSESTPIIVVGAAGRIGRMILECAGNSDDPFQLAGAVEDSGHPSLGQDLRQLVPGAPSGATLADALPPQCPKGTVAIIFALPEPTLAHLETCVKLGIGAVIGTTGFNETQLQLIAQAAQKIPVLPAPNMSVGVNVLCELVHRAVKLLGPEFDIEITEMHHRFKKDAPSGTARRLAEVALDARGGDYQRDTRHGREVEPKKTQTSREKFGLIA